MFDNSLIPLIHGLVGYLLLPVISVLAALVALAVWEAGLALGERFGGLGRLARQTDPERLLQLGRRRIERVEMLSRIGPMLGLMGTLIPLGPGLAALSQGDFKTLAEAVTIAFDTTVMGLLIGVIGFVLSRLRRRWYDELLDTMEQSGEMTA
ncbi:biopolymer transport protein ExbB/TolQ [Methylohalomonas lacus]|uniref:Biopolymer transport protein ExbB/TolQ n=1 Tax=Methylohalomonas lacus TaxID=398773 RepID=A0AAE3HKC2_9GAMM|nr:MotA/TolQ/ExbB proton channel family protein [Methylohalomonas lacus]MCS3902684.1 biopolymer transport protein ExbB/TolQ [Methylohalomonas lacus]